MMGSFWMDCVVWCSCGIETFALPLNNGPHPSFVHAFSFTNPVARVRPTPGQPRSFTAMAELLLHGVMKTVTVMLNPVLTGRGGQVTGSIPITFSDCGGPASGVEFVTVESAGSFEILLNPTQE
jgi:hypothetical protein